MCSARTGISFCSTFHCPMSAGEPGVGVGVGVGAGVGVGVGPPFWASEYPVVLSVPFDEMETPNEMRSTPAGMAGRVADARVQVAVTGSPVRSVQYDQPAAVCWKRVRLLAAVVEV